MPDQTILVGTLTVDDIDDTVNHEPRVQDLRLAEALGFTLSRNVRKIIRHQLRELAEFGEVCSVQNKPSEKGGRPGKTYYLNKRQALYIVAKSNTPLAAKITVQMVEIFDAWSQGKLPGATQARPVLIDHASAVRAFDKAVRDASGAIAGRARYLAEESYPVVVAIPHAPEKAETYRTGYMQIDGEEWWSVSRKAEDATIFKARVTTALRQHHDVAVLALGRALDLTMWRRFVAGLQRLSAQGRVAKLLALPSDDKP